MKFASDDIVEDIKEIMPQLNKSFSSQQTTDAESNNNKNDNIITSSFKPEYDKWAAASAASVTTSFYTNQIIYNEQGIAAWVCKCCEYLRMKMGDGYSAIFRQPFREG